MNQNVLFTDLQYWDALTANICFIAQSQGVSIKCYVNADKLYCLCGLKPSNASKNIDEVTIMLLFEQCRFELEELAEELIIAESFDEQGAIHL